MAEAITRELAAALGWDRLDVRSAGVGAQPGAPASGGALRTAARHGLDLSGHQATLLTEEAADDADLILTMSTSHLVRVAELGAGDRAALLTSYAAGRAEDSSDATIPDPIGGPDEEYEATFLLLKEMVEGVMKRLRRPDSS